MDGAAFGVLLWACNACGNAHRAGGGGERAIAQRNAEHSASRRSRGTESGRRARLLEHGADVNARQEGGWTALHAASQNGDVEMVRLLIAGGADVRARAENQQNSMDMALTKGHPAVVEVLEAYA